MPPSIAIATPVLGGPGTMRVVLNSSSRKSGDHARCVEQQQQQQEVLEVSIRNLNFFACNLGLKSRT